MGEFALIERVRARLAETGAGSGRRVLLESGDDAAVIDAGTSAVSVDAVVDGVHFRREVASPRAIGRKALAAALSDLAAMGAGAGEAFVVLGLPGDFGEPECDELLDGLVAGARDWGVALAGGDVVAAPVLFVSVTVIGPLDGEPIRRDGARPGQVVAVTGELGGAAAGLLLCERPALARAMPTGQVDELRTRQLEPVPRLAGGRALAAAGAAAMIDVSDGLGGDALHLARAGGVTVAIELERLPVAVGVDAVAEAAGRDPQELATAGGEDYELLVCLAPEALDGAVAAAGEAGLGLTAIGEVRAGPARVELRAPDGTHREPGGFDQLSRGGA